MYLLGIFIFLGLMIGITALVGAPSVYLDLPSLLVVLAVLLPSLLAAGLLGDLFKGFRLMQMKQNLQRVSCGIEDTRRHIQPRNRGKSLYLRNHRKKAYPEHVSKMRRHGPTFLSQTFHTMTVRVTFILLSWGYFVVYKHQRFPTNQ